MYTYTCSIWNLLVWKKVTEEKQRSIIFTDTGVNDNTCTVVQRTNQLVVVEIQQQVVTPTHPLSPSLLSLRRPAAMTPRPRTR